MDATASSFSTRSNAKRAAEKMIAKGTAPTVDYGIKPSDDGRFEIVWKTALTTAEFSDTAEAQANQANWNHELEKAEAEGWLNTDPTTDELETEIATASVTADEPATPGAPPLRHPPPIRAPPEPDDNWPSRT